MKISKLIAKLEKAKEKHGDIEVFIREEGFGGYAVHECTGLEQGKEEIELYDCLESRNAEELKDYFPDVILNDDGEPINEYDVKPLVGVVIAVGIRFYAT